MFPNDPHIRPYTLIQPAKPGPAHSLADKFLASLFSHNTPLNPQACFVQGAQDKSNLQADWHIKHAGMLGMTVHHTTAPSGRTFAFWIGLDGSVALGHITNGNDMALYPDSVRLNPACTLPTEDAILALEVERLWDARAAGQPIAFHAPYAPYTDTDPFTAARSGTPIPLVPAWLPTANLLMHMPRHTGWHRREEAPLSHSLTKIFLHAVRILIDRITSGAFPPADLHLLQAILMLGLPARDHQGLTRATRPRFCVLHKRSMFAPQTPSTPRGLYLRHDHPFCENVASKVACLPLLDLPTSQRLDAQSFATPRVPSQRAILLPSVIELRLNAFAPNNSAHQRLQEERRWSEREQEPEDSPRVVSDNP